MYDVFISYAREDLDFVEHLKKTLQASDRKVWVDIEGAYAGEEFWPQICNAIERANTFVCVISPSSVRSHYCQIELDHALHHNKRIIPVICHEVEEHNLPSEIAKTQWIFFRNQDSFEKAYTTLIKAIDLDFSWLKTHTRLLMNALDWDNRNRDKSYVLRGDGLNEAERWLSEASSKEPAPTPLQVQFIITSRRITTLFQRKVLGWISVGFVISAILGAIAFYQYQLSEKRGKVAISRLLASQANDYLDTHLDLAMLLSLEANRVHPTDENLDNILAGLQHNTRLISFLHSDIVISGAMAFSSDGNRLAAGSIENSILLWDVRTKSQLSTQVREHSARVIDIKFSADNKYLLSVDVDGVLVKWDLVSNKVKNKINTGHPEQVITAVFSKDGNTLALAGRYYITFWNVKTNSTKGNAISTQLAIVNSLSFSPDGQRLLSGDIGTGIIEWDVNSQKQIGDPIKIGGDVLSVAYSPDSIMMASGTRWITLWDLQKREPIG